MRLPTSLKGRDDWERFAFQAESYLAVVDTRYPAELEIARKCKVPLQVAAMTEEVRTLSVRLFGMLGSWTQDSATAVKLARGVKGQNGFELWRLLWQEHNPENESKNLTWRRTLLMPKFPPKESDFSLALQEWEADVDRYASEYGAGRALADEDLRAVLVTESPTALRQHLAMHAASLSTYAEVREVVVSYLQAKRVWTPSAGYAASSRRDPNAMDIGRIGDRDGKEGKGKGDKGKKGDKDHRKGKGDHDNKGKGKGDKKGNQQGGRDGKERCPICWKTGHTVKECWFNAKGKGKGTKGQVAQVADDAATTVSTASLATAGPSASQVGGSTGGSGGKGQVRQVRDDRILGVRFAPPHDTEPEEDKILKVSGSLLVDSGACVSVCRPEAFPDLQPAGPPKSLYSVDNSRLKTKGRVQPSLLLGEERQSCKVNFEVTEDIEDEILSISRAVEAGAGIWLHREDSHILWPDGVRASILKRGSQFLLPYERELPPGSTNRVAPVAAEPPNPGKDLGHYEYIPEHDLEAREVEDAAMEAAADEEAAAAEEEEAAGNPAPLEEQAEQPDSRPRGLRAPRNPTAQERAEHELTHTPYQAWCEKCVEGKAREDPHRRREPSDDPVTPLVTMDYQFYSRDGKEVEEEASLATVLNLTDRATGWTLSAPVAHKGHRHAAYAAGLVEQFVDRLGYDKFTLQADQENAIASVARAVHRRLGAARVRLRDAPRGSHQSQGSVEGRNAHLAGEVRTWLSQLRADYPALEWDTSSNLFPWLVRHVAWLQARFGTKSTDGVTPYRAATGTDYGGALCSFGETVLAKLPRPGNKAQVRWVKGVWAGKLERDDSHVVLTEAGALNVRSVRRLPPETRHQTAAVLKACGLPWNPRFGRSAPAERSEPMMVPIPLATPAEETERLEPPGEPWLFSDGPRPDDEALLVEGAEQASRLPDASPTEELANAEIPDYEPSDVEAGPSAASALPQQAANPAPAANDGSGEGGQKRDSAGSSASAAAAQQPPAAKSRVEPKKAPRLGALTEREVWQHIAALADPPLTNHKGERDAWVGQVTDLLDRMLDPKQVEQARKEQLRKLWDRGAFTPVLRSEVPRGAQLFRAKWVDKCDKGRYKSRCTCADVKARYSPEQEAGLDVFVPTPTPESHSLLEVAALHNEGWVTRSLDIVAAFLIGKDRGAAEGRPVYMHAPVEWRELFDQWVLEQPAKDQQWYRDHFRDFVFRVDGNLYGRRTAGSVYRDELEEVLTGKLAKDYDFQRGVKDPCVYLDRRSGLILLHHIDDIRVAGPKAAVLKFTEVDLPTHCEITVGELEEPGTAVEVLGRTKVRTEDSILTLPDNKHAENVCEQLGIGPKDKGTVPSKPLDLTKVEELSAGDAARFRSAVGSAIYLSADRRDIQFAVKELARRMQNPRVCDWLAAETLARYLRATPRFGRVVVLDPASKSTALLNLEVYSDSDWAGCPETRRSTDNIVACLGGAVIQTSCQTQPGLPATSSGDAEIRGVSRAAREAVFLRELAEKDFALACGVPRLWADSAASIGAAKRIGPGSKLRHLEVAEFFVQGALRAKLLELRKVKGTENPANFATKHAKTGPEVRQSLPSMGMVDLDAVAGATEALAQKGTIKTIQTSPWKMRPPTKLASSALMATIVALQVRPAKAQGHDFAELVLGFAALGFLAFLWMLWGLVSWLCRCRRDRQEPEPEDEIEHHAERAEEPPRAAQRATEVWLGPEAPQEAQEERREQQPRGAQEPEPEGERTPGPPPAAAPPPPPPAAPRVRRRRRGPEPLSGDDEHLYETARGDKIHLFTNCNGLSSVPPDQILIGFRCHCAADPQNSEFLWTGFAFQVATGRVVRRYHGQQRGCPFMEGATIRHRVCLHCRNGHQSTKPGSAVNNSRQWGEPFGCQPCARDAPPYQGEAKSAVNKLWCTFENQYQGREGGSRDAGGSHLGLLVGWPRFLTFVRVCKLKELEEVTKHLDLPDGQNDRMLKGLSYLSYTALPETFRSLLILGKSGSGKSTMLQRILQERFGLSDVEQYPTSTWPEGQAIIDSFPDAEAGQKSLGAAGLSAVRSHLKTFASLSRGEQYRAATARRLLERKTFPTKPSVFDEWTSELDPHLGNNISRTMAKYIRKEPATSAPFIFATCRAEVLEFLNPEYVLVMEKGHDPVLMQNHRHGMLPNATYSSGQPGGHHPAQGTRWTGDAWTLVR
ncbi:unnamed protein product [Symbiodinium sp. CCMP2592]|nr:unnamed protein product [Symbiodinium sp. CCMP2592]